MNYKERYGIPGKEINNLSRRWNKDVKNDSTWNSFNDFVLWCSQNGYGKGYELRRYNDFEPHSPDNSFFFSSKIIADSETKIADEPEKYQSDFCQRCTKNCLQSHGCPAWKRYFVNNWNRKISINPRREKIREFWQYEHPDLIREGIVYGKT